MNLKQFLAGVKILRKYYNDPDGYHIDAVHDIVYMYSTDKPLTPQHVKELRDLGWFQRDLPETEYDPEEGWEAYV